MHKHSFGGKDTCLCGVVLCSSVKPGGKIVCNLEKGHQEERCANTWHPEAGTWKKRSGRKKP